MVSLCCLIIIITSTGCKKNARTDSRHGFITFEINRDTFQANTSAPETLRFCFYPSNSDVMTQMECDSGNMKIALPPGTYRLLVYSTENEVVRLRNRNSFKEVEAYLALIQAENIPLSTPTHLYGAVIDSLVIAPGQNVTMPLTPILYTKQVHFDIHIDPAHLRNIKNCSAQLSNVLPSFHISDFMPNREDRTVIPITLEKNEKGFSGKAFLLNAKYDEKSKQEYPHALKIDFELNDGQDVSALVDLKGHLKESLKDIYIQVEAEPILIQGEKANYACRLKLALND